MTERCEILNCVKNKTKQKNLITFTCQNLTIYQQQFVSCCLSVSVVVRNFLQWKKWAEQSLVHYH